MARSPSTARHSGDGEAWNGEGACSLTAGRTASPSGASNWRRPAASPSVKGILRSQEKLAAALETMPQGELLLRGDSVAFPPGGCAFRTSTGAPASAPARGRRSHRHPRPLDLLRPGRALVRDRHRPGVRAGRGGPAEPLHPRHVLPRELLGKSSFQFVNEDDKAKPACSSTRSSPTCRDRDAMRMDEPARFACSTALSCCRISGAIERGGEVTINLGRKRAGHGGVVQEAQDLGEVESAAAQQSQAQSQARQGGRRDRSSKPSAGGVRQTNRCAAKTAGPPAQHLRRLRRNFEHHPLDRHGRVLYLTNLLFNLLAKLICLGPPERHVFRPRRPDAPRDPGAAGAGRDLGDGAGRAVRHEPARRLQASQGAGARRPDRARPRGAVAALPDRGRMR